MGKFKNRFGFGLRWVAALLVAAGLSSEAQAFSAADADAAFTAYNKAFYFTNASGGFYRATTEGGKTWFWERAEQLEMLLDVYGRTTNAVCLTMFSNVFNGFIADHGSKWTGNEFNDDLMWMVIACARAHQITGNPAYREAAKVNFDLCFARAWSTNLGGGLWWKTSNRSKNACVNGPAAIAAHLLFQIYGDTNYLTKAENLFRWERANLFNPANGQVYDNMSAGGKVDVRAFSYNQGTFVGIANLLGQTNDAVLAADYAMNVMCQRGLMPSYGDVGDAGGFNGICARWLARFMNDRGLQGRYQPWLQQNADAAWENRRGSDNLAWSRWRHPTPGNSLHSWSCSSAVVLMHVVPPNQPAMTTAGHNPPPMSPAETGETNSAAGKILVWNVVATNAAGTTLATITITATEAPDLADWAQRVSELCGVWYPRLASLLASEEFTAPGRVRLNLRTNYNGVAATSGSHIDVSANYVRRAPADFGMVIHELVHVVQSYGGKENPGWLVEGIADYIRLVEFEPTARRPKIDAQRASYRDAYKTTAIFLEWVSNKYDPQLVAELNRAMREGNFKLDLFKARTGKSVDELWSEFVESLRLTGQ